MPSKEILKRLACKAIDKASDDLHQVSQEIWEHPEENYQEKYAHKVLTDFLEKYKFPVERHYVVDTGFRSVYGDKDKPNISVLCEYDCLPGIGHACGHNLIAEAGIGAAVGIKAALDAAADEGEQLGKLTVLGTPAEEEGGGKIDMINANAFDTVDMSMMTHPFPLSTALFYVLTRDEVKIKFHGKASHAAAFPWEGVNALDAAVMVYSNISVMRQQMKQDWRVHGIITNGGAKPNIIPEESAMEYYIRTPYKSELELLRTKVNACFNAAAEATGCTVDIEWCQKPYDNMIINPTLVNLFTNNAKQLGIELCEDQKKIDAMKGSTDMGNVSHLVPSLHPMFYIGKEAMNHTREFTAVAGDPKAQPYTLAQAKAMAMTAIDVYCQPDLVDKMKEEFRTSVQAEKSM